MIQYTLPAFELFRPFAPHARTGVWHMTCRKGSRCDYRMSLQLERQADMPPPDAKYCAACVGHSHSWDEFEVRRALQRWSIAS